LKKDWDITLFHYRNHGHDVAKVLCGIALPEGTEEEEFQTFLNTLGYKVNEETENVVYKKFLKN
jgi:threonine dehydratase